MKRASERRPRPTTTTTNAKAASAKPSRAKAPNTTKARPPKTKAPQTTKAKMLSYATFDAWLDARSAAQAKMVGSLRKLAARVSKQLVETVKWGNACWELDGLPIAFIHGERDHLQFGFFVGAALDDPRSVLTGSGKYVRSQKLFSPNDIDAKYLARLFAQALTLKYRASRAAHVS
jgi:hypothetical protein